ncbi:MAG: hypothetical protein JWN07_192 [Hyphomicrobiales bacterium]|nr:hypothetical protein [Hyphomicrobiales bacterium]
MRLIIGIVFGFLLTVAGAYVHDSGSVDASARLVNWDVADRTFNGARENAQRGWDRMTGRQDFTTSTDGRERL